MINNKTSSVYKIYYHIDKFTNINHENYTVEIGDLMRIERINEYYCSYYACYEWTDLRLHV